MLTDPPGLHCFRRSIPGLHAPLSTLRVRPHGRTRMTRGRCGSLRLHRNGLAPSISCRSPGAPRPNGAPRFRCSACRRAFSPTSGTLFPFHKLEIRDYLAAVVIFCDEVKGKAALSRDLDVQYKTAFVLAHKIREAMASEVKDLQLGGAGRHVEVDGCYVGGHVRPANRKADRKDLRLAENRSGRRQVVVVIRERALSGTSLGGTLPAVFASEDAAASFIRARVDRASTVHADESS